MFDQMFNLTPQGWRMLTLRWALFFFAMAILNEIIWRTQSTDFWVSFKVFGVIPLTMVFAITQMPLIKRYQLEPVSLEASEAEAGDVARVSPSFQGVSSSEPGIAMRMRNCGSELRSIGLGMTVFRPRLQRLVDLGLEHGVDIVRA